MSMIQTAMVLAAGRGLRMMPLTATTAKPLLKVGSKTMLDHVLDRVEDAGVETIVVNASYCADQIAAQVAARRNRRIHLSLEIEPLETGGGIKQALPLLGDGAIFALNSDLPWTEQGDAALRRMAKIWDPNRMDVLLLVLPLARANGFTKGDFYLAADGRLQRQGAALSLNHVYIGVQIVKTALYRTIQEKTFSNNIIFDEAERQERLYGLEHAGSCYHVGTPADLAAAQDWFAAQR